MLFPFCSILFSQASAELEEAPLPKIVRRGKLHHLLFLSLTIIIIIIIFNFFRDLRKSGGCE